MARIPRIEHKLRPGFCANGDGKRAEPPNEYCPECKEAQDERMARLRNELDEERAH